MMNSLPPKGARPDTTGWPVLDAVPSGVYLGPFVHDCWPNLTAEQKALPVIDAVPSGVFLGSYDQDGKRLDRPEEPDTFGVDSLLTEFTDTAHEGGEG